MSRQKEIMKTTVMRDGMYFLKMKRSKKKTTSNNNNNNMKKDPVTWIHPTLRAHQEVKKDLHKVGKKTIN
jgi:hypothetical protein